QEKVILRQLANRLLPAGIADRTKQPYRAPGVTPFFGDEAPGWVEDLLSRDSLDAVGMWDPSRVEGLLRRCRAGRVTGAREEMAFVGVLTTQLWHQAFMTGARQWPQETATPQVFIDRTSKINQEQGAGI